MIERNGHVEAILELFRTFRVVAILGPRQIGKTTLAGQVGERFGAEVHRFDLEDPGDLNRLQDDAKLALTHLRGLIVIDEVQRRPDLFPLLRVLADRPARPARFLILGSASPELIRQSSESLAGRISYRALNGLTLAEIGAQRLPRRWLRGGFPDAFLAPSDGACFLWLENFIRTFLERDIPQLGIRVTGPTLRRFWTMLAHWHGQIWNSSEFARSFGVADTTIRHYLDILTGALVVRQLQPWHANVSKRQVKAPKIYLRDAGLVHALLGITTRQTLDTHPKMGASWEGLVLEFLIDVLNLDENHVYFWATHGGAELDVLANCDGKRIGFEIKRTSAPRVTPSMRSALSDLELAQLIVLHAGETSYPLGPRIQAVAVERMLEDLDF